jgi:hypothetical protein
LAAAIAIARFSLILACPIKSSRHLGRRLKSSGMSSAPGLPEITRSILFNPQNILQLTYIPDYTTSLPGIRRAKPQRGEPGPNTKEEPPAAKAERLLFKQSAYSKA